MGSVVTEPRPLTQKQQRFVAEYTKDRNGTQAALRAGYSPNGVEVTASKLLRVAKVNEALAKVQSDALTRVAIQGSAITAARILEKAWSIANEEDADGKPARDRVPALALAAKTFPEFKDSAVIDQSQHVHLDHLSDEQLEALAKVARGV